MSNQTFHTLNTSLHELPRLKSSPYLNHRKITSLEHVARTTRSAQLSQYRKCPRYKTTN